MVSVVGEFLGFGVALRFGSTIPRASPADTVDAFRGFEMSVLTFWWCPIDEACLGKPPIALQLDKY
ncbi:MAG: hypothetical protein ACFFB3_19595 [Candidatus Hodarchaeota archaeon]